MLVSAVGKHIVIKASNLCSKQISKTMNGKSQIIYLDSEPTRNSRVPSMLEDHRKQ